MLYEIGYRPTEKNTAIDARYFWTLRKECLEAFIRTANPWSEDFDLAMRELFEVRAELAALEKCLDQIHERETMLFLTGKTMDEYMQMLLRLKQEGR